MLLEQHLGSYVPKIIRPASTLREIEDPIARPQYPLKLFGPNLRLALAGALEDRCTSDNYGYGLAAGHIAAKNTAYVIGSRKEVMIDANANVKAREMRCEVGRYDDGAQD